MDRAGFGMIASFLHYKEIRVSPKYSRPTSLQKFVPNSGFRKSRLPRRADRRDTFSTYFDNAGRGRLATVSSRLN